VWLPQAGGPAVVAIRADGIYDVSKLAPTMRDLCEAPDPAGIVRTGKGERIGALVDILANTLEGQRDSKLPWLLAPVDLQAIKAAGVTFPLSMLERVIEEQARGSPEKAEAIRKSIAGTLGGNLAKLVPGSPQAAELKRVLIEQGAWSQYLEVGIGPDAEIFTKAQPMAAVGHLAEAGLNPMSAWNNPEPEVVLVVSSRGRIVGATLAQCWLVYIHRDGICCAFRKRFVDSNSALCCARGLCRSSWRSAVCIWFLKNASSTSC